MKYRIHIWMPIAFLWIANVHMVRAGQFISVNANKTKSVIGGPVGIQLSVKSDDKTAISWRKFDSTLAAVNGIEILKTATEKGGKMTVHSIIFTSLSAREVSMNKFPVLVNNNTVFPVRIVIRFNDEPLASDIDDIKPIDASAVLPSGFIFYSMMVVSGVFAILIAISLTRRISQKINRSPGYIRKLAVNRLNKLQQPEGSFEEDSKNDHAFSILKDFLANIDHTKLSDHDHDLVRNILNDSMHTRFMVKTNVRSSAYFTRVKQFISELHYE